MYWKIFEDIETLIISNNVNMHLLYIVLMVGMWLFSIYIIEQQELVSFKTQTALDNDLNKHFGLTYFTDTTII